MTDIYSSAERSRLMSQVRSQNTKPERRVRSKLHRLGYRFRLHRDDLPGSPDIVLPKFQIAIFVHGCFWHGHNCPKGALPKSNVAFWRQKIDRNRERDDEAVTALRKMGWDAVTVWECATTNEEQLEASLEECLPETGRGE